jgi:hypothetical protein
MGAQRRGGASPHDHSGNRRVENHLRTGRAIRLEVRALLTARKLVQSKLYDIEMSLRGILRGDRRRHAKLYGLRELHVEPLTTLEKA